MKEKLEAKVRALESELAQEKKLKEVSVMAAVMEAKLSAEDSKNEAYKHGLRDAM